MNSAALSSLSSESEIKEEEEEEEEARVKGDFASAREQFFK